MLYRTVGTCSPPTIPSLPGNYIPSRKDRRVDRFPTYQSFIENQKHPHPFHKPCQRKENETNCPPFLNFALGRICFREKTDALPEGKATEIAMARSLLTHNINPARPSFLRMAVVIPDRWRLIIPWLGGHMGSNQDQNSLHVSFRLVSYGGIQEVEGKLLNILSTLDQTFE